MNLLARPPVFLKLVKKNPCAKIKITWPERREPRHLQKNRGLSQKLAELQRPHSLILFLPIVKKRSGYCNIPQIVLAHLGVLTSVPVASATQPPRATPRMVACHPASIRGDPRSIRGAVLPPLFLGD